MRVPEAVRECVVYLGLPVDGPDGRVAMRPVGTAFFVSIKDDALENWAYTYLVTAKHVAQALDGKEFVVRANLRDGGATFVNCTGIKWWYHPTDLAVDVALFPWAPPPQTFEFRRIYTDMFLTDEIIRSKSNG